jgi:ABC-type Fe3+-hydroxamate transport system substrate-binding protein
LLKLFVFVAICVGPTSLGVTVAATSPQTTELLFQLGKGKTVVAGIAIQGLEIPKEFPTLANLGSFFVPSIERLVKLAPNWVIIDKGWSDAGLTASLDTAKIPHFTFGATDVNSFFTSAKDLLLRIYGEYENKRLSGAQLCYDNLRPADRPFTFVGLTWIDPPILFGQQTLFAKLAHRIGGVPLSPSRGPAYPQVSEEWMIAHRPDVIYFMQQDASTLVDMQRASKKWWPNHEPKLIGLNPGWFSRASLTPFEHLTALYPETPKQVFHDCAS